MTKVDPGQGILPDMPEMQPKPVVLKERAAVGRLMGRRAMDLLGVSPDQVVGVTDEALAGIDPESLRLHLYSDTGMSIGGVAVNETEYEVIPRWAPAIRTKVSATTERARKIDQNLGRREAAVQRSVGHALEGKEERSAGILEWLSSEREQLTRLKKELNGYHGHAHMSQGELLQLYRRVIDFSFMNILDVVAKQKELSPEEVTDMEAAFKYMLTQSSQDVRRVYLAGMTSLALEYNRTRTNVFKNRLKIARTVADKALHQSQTLTP